MAIVTSAAMGAINTAEGAGVSLVILIAMVVFFGAAAYFTGRLHGKAGMIAAVAGFVAVAAGARTLGGLSAG